MIVPDVGEMSQRLCIERFRLAKVWGPQKWFTFVRESISEDLYESISFESSERKGIRWHGIVRLSIMEGTHWLKDFTPTEYLKGMHDIVKSRADRQRWTDALCSLASPALSEFANRKGSALLSKTASVRQWGHWCLRQLPLDLDVWALRKHLLTRLTSEQIEEARNLACEPSINNLSEEEPTYEMAALALLTLGPVNSDWFHTRKWSNTSFVVRLHFLADLIFRSGIGKRLVDETRAEGF